MVVILFPFYDIFICIMKLILKVRETAEERGVKTAYQLQKKAGIAPSTAYRFFNNKATQLTIETLEKICSALDCNPGDLIVRDGQSARTKQSKKQI